MYNRRYDKAFLMLRQETAGYGLSQKTPWGSCVMEIKNGEGKIHVTVQGLRPLQRGDYDVFAIADGMRVYCGKLFPSKATGGQAELKWSFDPEAVDGNRLTAEDLHTIAVVAQVGGSGENVSAPLVAYFKEKRKWKDDFLAASRVEQEPTTIPLAEERAKRISKAVEIQTKTQSEQTETAKEAEPNLKAAEETDDMLMMGYHGDFRGLIERFHSELEELETKGVLYPKDMDKIHAAAKLDHAREQNTEVTSDIDLATETEEVALEAPSGVEESTHITIVPETENVVVQVTPEEIVIEAEVTVDAVPEETEIPLPTETETQQEIGYQELFLDNMVIQPFANGEDWKAISLEELVHLDRIPLNWLKDFFFILAMRRFNHLIWRQSGEGFVLGVPARYDDEDLVPLRAMGFVYFEPVDEDGKIGYWIYQDSENTLAPERIQ